MRVWVTVLLLAALVGGGALYWHHAREADRRRGKDVQEALSRTVQHKLVATPRELADFDFDRLVVVYGTASEADIDRALGFDWRRAEDQAYECCDPAPLWMFVRGDEVVAFLRPGIDVSYGDCVRAGRSYRPDARLRLRACREGGGIGGGARRAPFTEEARPKEGEIAWKSYSSFWQHSHSS